jgi:peptide/nickel transport system substrate-binding protein
MLDAAGYKAGTNGERFKITIDYYPGDNSQQKNTAEYLSQQLKKLGIKTDVRTSADFPSWAKRMATHDFDMSMDGGFMWGDPVIGIARTYLSTNIKPVVWTNTQSYRNTKVDELLNEASRTLDISKRKAAYAAFSKIATDELPLYVIDGVGDFTVANKKVGNVPTSIWGTLSPFDEVFLN